MQFLGKQLTTLMIMITSTLLLVFLVSSFVTTISLHNMVYAQNSNTTGLGSITNLIFNGKSSPIKYNITTAAAKLLGLVEDKDKTTLIALISSPSDKGTLTLEVPRNIVDAKKEGNADDKFTVHVDGSKDATFREISNNNTTRTIAIDFNKDARLIEIIGTVSRVQ